MIVLRVTGKEPGSLGHGITGATAVRASSVAAHRAYFSCKSDKIAAFILAANPHIGGDDVSGLSHC